MCGGGSSSKVFGAGMPQSTQGRGIAGNAPSAGYQWQHANTPGGSGFKNSPTGYYFGPMGKTNGETWGKQAFPNAPQFNQSPAPTQPTPTQPMQPPASPVINNPGYWADPTTLSFADQGTYDSYLQRYNNYMASIGQGPAGSGVAATSVFQPGTGLLSGA
jgi:hypothetical protein